MKRIYIATITALLGTALFFSGCDKDDDNHGSPDDQTGSLKIHLDHKVDLGNEIKRLRLSTSSGSDIPADSVLYINASGNEYTVSQLRYFVGDLILVKDDLSEVKIDQYYLIQHRHNHEPDEEFVLSNIPTGRYVSIKFKIGVKPEDNASAATEGKGELVVGDGMNWTWDTGYIFYKQEGQFKTNDGDWKNYRFHIGTDAAYPSNYTESVIPGGIYIHGGETSSIHYMVNLNALFGLQGHAMHGSQLVDLNTTSMVHANNAALTGNWAAHMFEIDHTHEPHNH